MNQALLRNMTADEIARYATTDIEHRLVEILDALSAEHDEQVAELETESERLVAFERDKAGDLMRQLIEEHTETKLSLGSELERLQELDADLWELANTMDADSSEYLTLSNLLGELQCSLNGVHALVTARQTWTEKTIHDCY